MNTDPISDLLTRIRNAMNANHQDTTCPHSKLKENILGVMQQYGFIDSFSTETTENNHKNLVIKINEDKDDLTLKRISKPGQRIYIKKDEVKLVRRGLGITVLSTSRGVMSNVEAKKHNVGGEVLCEIY